MIFVEERKHINSWLMTNDFESRTTSNTEINFTNRSNVKTDSLIFKELCSQKLEHQIYKLQDWITLPLGLGY